MTLVTDLRKSVTDTTPLLAVVGATDLAVERVRTAVANADKVQAQVEARVERAQTGLTKAVTDFDVKSLPGKAQAVPSLLVAKALEAAGKAEASYEDLAARGADLVERIRTQRATKDLIGQGKATLSRTKAAVTTVRRGTAATATSGKATVTTGRNQAAKAAGDVAESAKSATRTTRTATKRTTTTARKRVATTRSTTKAAVTSARKTAAKAVEAVEAAAEKVGD